MAAFNTTSLVIGSAARPPLRPQLRVARADTFRCAYSKEALKACSAMNLSPEVLKGLGLRRVSRPWGSELVEERVDTGDTRLRRVSRQWGSEPVEDRIGTRLQLLSRALNPEWVLACVLGYILFNPRRLRRYYDDNESGLAASRPEH